MARIRTIKKFEWSFDRRFMSRVEKTEHGCWVWLGAKMRNGYGQLVVGGVHYAAHRYAYQEMVGAIPAGLDLDHLCRNRACTNPDHLEPVTRSENLLRGLKRTHNLEKTHCPSGHEYSAENTYVNGNRRQCRACANARASAKRNSYGTY